MELALKNGRNNIGQLWNEAVESGLEAAHTQTAENKKAATVGGVKFMIRDVSFDESEFYKNSLKLQKMNSVQKLTGEEFPNDGTPIDKRILSYFNSLGNNVYSDTFGDVALTNSSVHDVVATNKTETTKVGEVTPSTTETATLNDSLYMTSILQRAYNVKENSNSRKKPRPRLPFRRKAPSALSRIACAARTARLHLFFF